MHCTHVARRVSLHVASRSSGLVEQNGSLLPAPGISATSLFERQLYPFHTAPVLGNAGVHFGRMGRCQYGPAIMPWQCPIVQEHFISIFSTVC